VSLGDGVARHARVLRLGPGNAVRLVDGAGRGAVGTIVRLSRESLAIEIAEVRETPAPPAVHLLVPVADRDRMLWLAEKCTELAASSWRPVLWRRSRSVRPRGEGPTFASRVRARMIAALEQSGGTRLPVVYPEATPARAVSAAPEGTRILLHPDGAPVLGVAIREPVSLAIGPEGGVDEEEREALRGAGFVDASLTGDILRFETAAIAALSIARAALTLAGENANVD
jgi:16S rRNA (uracil1498-N3)-methyltransferase